jgi:signal transduction histidine kinase
MAAGGKRLLTHCQKLKYPAMFRIDKGRAPFNKAGFRILLMLVLAVAAVMPVSPTCAQTSSTITNLSQLTQTLSRRSRVVGEITLKGTVFASDTNSGALILSDDSGVAFLECDGLQTEFQPGDLVEINDDQCYLNPGDLGIYVTAAPLVNNDGIHGSRTISGAKRLTAGRYPLRVDWFNQFNDAHLKVSCTRAPMLESPSAETPFQDLIHIVHAECFEGYWFWLPNFQLLCPVKTVAATNVNIGLRTHDHRAGLRFDGYFEAPETGDYSFSLYSVDGARLWVGDIEVPVINVGANVPPAAPSAIIGEAMANLNERRLVTIEGRVGFASRSGKGLRLEVLSEKESILVEMSDAGSLVGEDLLNAYVRVSGVAQGVLTQDRQVVMGKLAVVSPKELTVIRNPPGKGSLPPVLTTLMQVQSLSSDDAARRLPVTIRGVVTAVGQARDHWMAIQDDTRGGFVNLDVVSNLVPVVGQYWTVSGHTRPGDFAPIVVAEHASLHGSGRLPEPVHPSWNQLVNGSMDVQFVELEGLVTGVQSNKLSLLLPEGRQEIKMPEWEESELKPFDNAVVSIRGTLFAVWNAGTHEVRSGYLTMHTAAISVEKPSPADPFDAPEKTPRGLFHFDAKASPFQRVKVRGQVTYADSQRIFVENGAGIQVIPARAPDVHIGDFVEAAGYPEVSVAGPTLREARLRKIDDGVLSPAALIPDAGLGDEHLASMRIRVQGNLVGQHTEDGLLVLQVETGTHLLPARVEDVESVRSLRLGSRLALTGIYVSVARDRFALFLNSANDLVVISKPSWWTLGRLLAAVGILLVSLALAAVWIASLHRQVAQRTLQLQREVTEREVAEREHSLEAERSRIARDLHDDLGASLTEISVLSSTGQQPDNREQSVETIFRSITGKAKESVSALDIIVWALDPKDNSLQLVGDYLCDYAKDYLSSFRIACRFDVPVALPPITFDGRRRHELFLAVKETLNNIVRHASATEVEFRLVIADDELQIVIVDNGKGFKSDSSRRGHGLKNLPLRLSQIGGSYGVESTPGKGTVVKIALKYSGQTPDVREEGAGSANWPMDFGR